MLERLSTKALQTHRSHTQIDESFGFTSLIGAQRITGLSKSALYKLTALGKIPVYKPSGKLIFKISELINWIEQSAA
jgi:hypothetical protein